MRNSRKPSARRSGGRPSGEIFVIGPLGGATPREVTGLGLYIVKEIVDAHGGTIRVSSTERERTIFTVRWLRIVSTPSTVHGGGER